MGILWLVNGSFYRGPGLAARHEAGLATSVETVGTPSSLRTGGNRFHQEGQSHKPAISPAESEELPLPWPPPNSEVAARPQADLEHRAQSQGLREAPVAQASRAAASHNRPRDLTEYPSTVSELMSRGVVTMTAGTELHQALETLRESNFHHLPVVDEESRLVGLVSDHDLLGRDGTLEERMVKRVLTATPDTGLQEATEALVEERFHSLVVIDKERRPMGMITSFDILSFLVAHPAMKLWLTGQSQTSTGA